MDGAQPAVENYRYDPLPALILMPARLQLLQRRSARELPQQLAFHSVTRIVTIQNAAVTYEDTGQIARRHYPEARATLSF